MSDPGFAERAAGLARAADLAEGWVPADSTARARTVATSVAERERVYDRWVVVALAGGTGSGKSTLFNALVGREVVATGVRRPTTSEATAAVGGNPADAGDLLDFLGIERRREAPHGELVPADVVLIDLPDHDSDAVEHRLEVDRLVEKVDVFIWVVDPEKYADAELHEGYLRPLAEHAATFVVFLNQTDTITPGDRDEIVDDLRRLLHETGLGRARVSSGSALTGDGVAEVSAELHDRVSDGAAVREKLDADLRSAGGELAAGCPEAPPEIAVDATLATRIAEAAGSVGVRAQARENYRRDADANVGWFVLSWRRRVWERMRATAGVPKARRDSGALVSVPPVAGAAATQVGALALEPLAEIERQLPPAWAGRAREAAEGDVGRITTALDRELQDIDFSYRRPRWWSLWFALQSLLGIATLAGALWLTALFAVGWLQLPEPPLPRLYDVPVPTVLLVGGLLVGWLLGWIGRLLSTRGASRQATRARQRMEAAATTVIEADLIPQLETNRTRREEILDALELAAPAGR